ncbi:hypothetical protein E2C01_040839 [Portunus trituberculatus]|uniref:Uncharacterized protein n=1 Tax=Portunus trituberculatus TaxID=210409 RepID=A0A5B7FRV4_PORTR|nr:hypothetical protein [Portunus trituberculatus]
MPSGWTGTVSTLINNLSVCRTLENTTAAVFPLHNKNRTGLLSASRPIESWRASLTSRRHSCPPLELFVDHQ